MEMRPDWTILRYNDVKLNLSNNICYDNILSEKISNLIKNTTFDLRQYPDEAVAYQSLSEYHKTNQYNLAIGYGIGELIVRIMELKRLGSVSFISPTWPMIEIYSKIKNINYSPFLDYSKDSLYIANPSGVTGKCLTKSEIIYFLDKFDLVIIDEAYGDFSKKDFSVIDLAADSDNLIVLKTFSKSLSLAGSRFGYAISNLEIIKELQLKRPSCVINNFTLELARNLLDLIPDHVSRMIETRNYIENKYDCSPSHGNYVLFKEMPRNLKDYFLVKETDIGVRMALLNLDLFKEKGF